MPDLSQAEIDAIWAQFNSGGDVAAEEEPEEEIAPQPLMRHSARQGRTAYVPRQPKAIPKKNYKLYDFKDPKFFSKDQLRYVNGVYDNYAKHMSSFMSGTLRTECTVTLDTVEEQKYKEYNNALPDSIMTGVFSMEPIEGDFLYNITKPTAYTIIDRLLGGTGDDIVVQEDFSEIEQTLLINFFKSTVRYIKESWSNVIDVEPAFKRIETNARLSQLMPFEDTVLIVMLSVKIKQQEGNISVCIPCLNLETILSNASTYAHVSSRKKSDTNKEENRKNLLDHVKSSKLDVAGILGTTTLKLRDILYLQTGDTILLDKSVESPITVRVGPHELYIAEIGTKKNKLAVKIKDVL